MSPSCSPEGKILLSWRLIHFPLHIIDYVVAHEVAHLKELNHGPRFWATVERLLPGHQHARDELRRYPDEGYRVISMCTHYQPAEYSPSDRLLRPLAPIGYILIVEEVDPN